MLTVNSLNVVSPPRGRSFANPRPLARRFTCAGFGKKLSWASHLMGYCSVVIVLLKLVMCTEVSLAQKRSAVQLPAASQGYAVAVDPSMQFNERSVSGGRIDADHGVWRAAYRIKAPGPALATAEATARAWMAEQGERFGWATAEDLVLTENIATGYSAHLTFEQTFRGLPVHRRSVRVNLGRDGLPTMVLSAYAPHLKQVGSFDVVPSVTMAQARRLAEQAISAGGASSTEPVLVVYPMEVPLLAWRTIVWPADVPGEWEVLLNAHSGALVYVMDRTIQHHPTDTTHVVRRVDGKGMVWIPDPITSAGVGYGGDYADRGDANSPALNDERKEVPLLDIEQGSDGKYRLNGPYVVIDGTIDEYYAPPAEDGPDDFDYLRANQHFEAVQVYYHIDTSQRYVQSLDIGRDIQEGGVRANPHGFGNADNAAYFPALNALLFGDGGIDDAEDAGVILHEYGHALLEASRSGIFGANTEGKALHEGWSDYWATSYTRGLMEQGVVPAGDWKQVFSWDGNETWNGRRLGSNARYPDGFECVGAAFCNFYSDGLIWATSLMEIYDAIGKEDTDRLNLISHAYLNPPVTFADVAQAIYQADQDYHDGAHATSLKRIMSTRGYFECAPGTLELEHEPEDFVYDPSNPLLQLVLGVLACDDPAVLRTAHYSRNGESWNTGVMDPLGAGRHTYSIPLDTNTTTVDYYFVVEQASGTVTSLPSDAPTTVFSIDVVQDTEAPRIKHPYLTHVAQGDWPPSVEATITDVDGVESAWVEWEVIEPDGTRRPGQTFPLEGQDSRFTGRFPLMELSLRSRVLYRVWARDATNAQHVSVLPPVSMSPFTIHIIEKGILASYDADDDAELTADGEWRRVRPSYGLQAAHSGEHVWMSGTGDGPYTDQVSTSVLAIPEIDLINFPEAFLEFWHWHDFEHTGITAPTQDTEGTAYDGGNVKVSTDGGLHWQALEPVHGYTTILDAGNPMPGEQAYAGFSYGWRRALFSLPGVPHLLLRIEVGTGSGNAHASAHGYAGWAIDDLRILDQRPSDNRSPVLHSVPEQLINVTAGQGAPPIRVVASDDTGIESARAEFTFTPEGGTMRSGVVRLAMDVKDQSLFTGTFPVPDALQRGDRIDYRLRVRDFDENTLLVPAQDEAPFLIEVRLVEQLPVLASATATGLWTRDGSGGYAANGRSEALVSSIMPAPVSVPTNAEVVTLRLDHAMALESARGNVKVSADDGVRWEVMVPEGGYGEFFSPGSGHPMEGEEVFAPPRDEVARFDLTRYRGENVWLRIDLGTLGGSLGAHEFWVVRSAVVENATNEDAFELDTELELFGNYPDPATGSTTVSYALPESMRVRLDLYNTLGQRIQVLVDQEQAAGTHTVYLNLDGLAGGVYFLRMQAGQTSLVETLVLTH